MVARRASPLFFDPEDFDLVELVNRESAGAGGEQVTRLFDPYLHPRGIKELAAPSHTRIAHAVIQLLETLEGGHAEDRLLALRSLREEVLTNSSSSLKRNTARVLVAIMKQLVRERGNTARQLPLAHDFFAALSGRPSVIRRELKKYHLLEMPEEWNQIAFDHHVHDVNTKGRKSPTHLIADAWLKGIRDLNVIYYSYVPTEAASEISEAAETLGVAIRIGIELSARFRDKYVQFIWTPRGFLGREDFLEFLHTDAVQALFAEGREVVEYRKQQVLKLLASFNERHREALAAAYGVELEPLETDKFLRFVGVGQASLAHLADYIHHLLLPKLRERVGELQLRYRHAGAAERRRIEEEVARLDDLVPERIAHDYLRPEQNPNVPSGKLPGEEPDAPHMLKLTPKELVARLESLRMGYRLTLNPTNLSTADVLELLHDLEGAITHIEIFNLKDRRQGRDGYTGKTAHLRRILNSGSPIALKHAVQEVIRDIEGSSDPEHAERAEKLRHILRDIPRLISLYRSTYLRSRIGSDSIGRAGSLYGMGLAVRETLPPRAQRAIARREGGREIIPVRIHTQPVTRWVPRVSSVGFLKWIYERLQTRQALRFVAYEQTETFSIDEAATRLDNDGNVVTLGGFDPDPGNGFRVEPPTEAPAPRGWRYLNSHWKNGLKVLIGFLPAFLTFFLTKDWWLLAYFGAVIWFGITGMRNIVQSVVAGGAIFRSPLIKWNNLVSWERVSDSLLYTGFSVPLLDWLVKTEVLDRGFGITAGTAPVVLYAVIGLANGTYLVSHNTIRGLPRGAVIGNFFRSVLSVPIAIGINAFAFALLSASGWEEAEAHVMLQRWAAVIAKLASDLVAGIIEGTADRRVNLSTRHADYRAKIRQVLDIHGRLEMLLPEADVLAMLSSPKELLKTVASEARELFRCLAINALDLMYFWMYQPRARRAARNALAAASVEERQILFGAQRVLERERQITQMFLDHLVGKKFARALAFYLDKWPQYLGDLERLAAALREREHEGEAGAPATAPATAPAAVPVAGPEALADAVGAASPRVGAGAAALEESSEGAVAVPPAERDSKRESA